MKTLPHVQSRTQSRASQPRIYLDGTETYTELRQRGLSNALAVTARKRGWYIPRYHDFDYPQLEGPGMYAQLTTPEKLVDFLLRVQLARMHTRLPVDVYEDWHQSLLLEMWRRRHAPHITGNYPGYCMAMVKGLIRQWVIARERSPEVPWNEDLDTRAVA